MNPAGSSTTPDLPAVDAPAVPVGDEPAEDARTQRRRLAAVWLAAGSAVAAMVAVSWYVVVRNGGRPPGGDMIGHAAAAEWLRTLPWWDWRGWSDWFFGGQAIGVNYPPLGHAWMRFTHPAHGQMAAVAIGLLVLLPWGALRLARAVGYGPRGQLTAVGAVLVLAALSGNMQWVLSGFHYQTTFFGSWPAMVATVLGLFCAAWAAACRRPVACGVVAGIAMLFNATVVPGVAVVCVALLVTSGASFRRALRWCAIAGSAAVAVCAWWLVPFLAGWERLVRWEVPLARAWTFGGHWQSFVLVLLGVAAAWAARRGVGPSRRLALAALAGLAATLAGDLFGYLRVERWLEPAILVASLAAAGLLVAARRRDTRPVRPAWALLAVALLIVFVVVAGRWEVIPAAAWLLWWPRRTWAAAGALAWVGVLLWVPFWSLIADPAPPDPPPGPLDIAAAEAGAGVGGLLYLDGLYNDPAGDVKLCPWAHPWGPAAATSGQVRPLFGLYWETSAAGEFLDAEIRLRGGSFREGASRRPHWFEAWQAVGGVSVETRAAAEAVGARWFAACDADGTVSVTELPATLAGGVTVIPYVAEDAWHEAAVGWWTRLATGTPPAEEDPGSRTPAGPEASGASVHRVPVLSSGEREVHPLDQAAGGVQLHTGQDSLTVRVESPGWVWLRVPWDPGWRSPAGTPVRKGGPGHLVVWANRGATELVWGVPRAVDVAAAATTGGAALVAAALAAAARRRPFEVDPHRRRPAAEALEVFGATVDEWAYTAAGRAKRLVARARRGGRS